MLYFNTPDPIQNSDSNKNYNPIFKSDDFLSITVMGPDAAAVIPFNLPVNALQSTNNGYTQGVPSPQGYLIDAEGYIDFPVIGKLKLGGLSRTDAIELIKKQLQVYVYNANIQIRILNFKVTVLGEVKNPGTFTIPNERLTLLEAIGLAGDLNITAKRKKVVVIRDIDGKKSETRIDLTSKTLFSSPVYYLNQNDVVYIEPNRAKMNSSVLNPANAGIIISAVSLMITVAAFLTR